MRLDHLLSREQVSNVLFYFEGSLISQPHERVKRKEFLLNLMIFENCIGKKVKKKQNDHLKTSIVSETKQKI